MKLKIVALITAVIMLLPNYSFAVETAKGKTIRLETYSGTVTVSSGSGKEISVSEKMRVFDGYTVKTSNESEAYLSLDDTKAVKLGENTEIIIKKSWFSNKVVVISGELFFNVTKPLETNESLDISTSTMSMGIRGTSGTVSVKELKSDIQLYTGKVDVKGNGKNVRLTPGRKAVFDKDLSVDKLSENGEDIPSMALREIIKDKELLKEIENNTELNVENFEKQEGINSVREKEEELKRADEINSAKESSLKEKTENRKSSTEGRDVTGKSSGSGRVKNTKPDLTLEVLHEWGSNSDDISDALDEFVAYAENYSSGLKVDEYKKLMQSITGDEIQGIKGVIAEKIFYYGENPVYETDKYKWHFLGYSSVELFVSVFNDTISNIEIIPDTGV